MVLVDVRFGSIAASQQFSSPGAAFGQKQTSQVYRTKLPQSDLDRRGMLSMNKKKFGEWLDIGTNIAVVAGIVALAFEVSQNTKQLRAQASYNLLQNRLEARSEIVNNPEISEFWTRIESGDSITPADTMRIQASAEAALLKWHWEFSQYVDGNLSLTELPVNAYRLAYRGEYGVWLSGIPEAWLSLKDQLRPDFVAWMEANVTNH